MGTCLSYIPSRTDLLYHAISRDDRIATRLALAIGAPLNHGYDLFTPFGMACFYQHIEMIEMLLQYQTDVNIPVGIYTSTSALIMAAGHGFEAVFSLLLSHGADINFKQTNGVAAIHAACENRHLNIINILMARCDIFVTDIQGRSALFYAIKGISDSDTYRKGSYEDGFQIIQKLMRHSSMTKGTDFTPLCKSLKCDASREALLKAIKMLIDHQDFIRCKGYGDRSPLHEATAWYNVGAIELLVKSKIDTNGKDAYGNTPLLLACDGSGNREMETQLKIVALLLNHGANVNTKNRYGTTALHIVKYLQVASLLVARGASLMATDDSGKKPFEEKGKEDLLSYFKAAASAEKEKMAQNKAERDRVARQKAEVEKAARLRAEAERISKQKAEAERIARHKAETDRVAREKAETDRLACQKAEVEKVVRQKAEADRILKQKAEAERIARQKAENDRMAREKAAEEARMAQERAETERFVRLKTEEDREATLKAIDGLLNGSAADFKAQFLKIHDPCCSKVDNAQQDSLFHFAVRHKKPDVVLWLIDGGFIPSTLRNMARETPADIARSTNQPLMLALFGDMSQVHDALIEINRYFDSCDRRAPPACNLIRAIVYLALAGQPLVSQVELDVFVTNGQRDVSIALRSEVTPRALEVQKQLDDLMTAINQRKKQPRVIAHPAGPVADEPVATAALFQESCDQLRSKWIDATPPQSLLDEYAKLIRQHPRQGAAYRERGCYYEYLGTESTIRRQKLAHLNNALKDLDKALEMNSADDAAAVSFEHVEKSISELTPLGPSAAPPSLIPKKASLPPMTAEEMELFEKKKNEIKARKLAEL